MSNRSSADLVGKTIGNYRILTPLGRGGMGSVWLAEHRAIGHKAAIKILRPDIADDKELAERFFNEARAANLVKHPGIVEIFDYGESELGAYLVMEYLDGESLGSRLRRLGRLPPTKAATLVARVASALGAAHGRGLVHRDLKPDNILLVPDPDHPGEERVKVLDFGIAKVLEAQSSGGVHTQTGTMVGTPAYMSPEHCRGSKAIDHRTDIYALGVIAYEMLTGRVPFLAEGYGEILVMHITEPPPPLTELNPDISEQVQAVVLKALEKDRTKRFDSMDELAKAMARAVGLVAPGNLSPSEAALLATLAAANTSDTIPTPFAQSAPADAAALSDPSSPSTLSRSAVSMHVAQSTSRRWPLAGAGVLALGLVTLAAAWIGGWFDADPGSGSAAVEATDGAGRTGSSGRVEDLGGAGTAATGRLEPGGTPARSSGAAAPASTPATASAAASSSARAPETALAGDRVELQIDSIPRGAHVYAAASTVSLGKTPLRHYVPRAPGNTDLVLRKKGYKEKRIAIATAAGGRHVVRLVKTGAATRPKTGYSLPD